MGKFVPKNPKLNKSSRGFIDSMNVDGHYFNNIDQYFISDQEEYEKKWTWKGFLSPSARLSWNMCMRTLIGNARTYNKMDPGGMRKVKMGNILHAGFAEMTKYCKTLRYPEQPNFRSTVMRRKYELIRPEIPINCEVTGWAGKIDEILNIDGYPGIFDLKTCYINPQNFPNWVRQKLPKIENVVQVCIYFNRVTKAQYYSRNPTHIGLGYINVMSDPTTRPQRWEWWREWDDELEERTQAFIWAAAVARREALLGVATEEITCVNPRCRIHGKRSPIWTPAHSKRAA